MESVQNDVLTVRSGHASREFLRTLGRLRDDGLFLDVTLGRHFSNLAHLHFYLRRSRQICVSLSLLLFLIWFLVAAEAYKDMTTR